jgi:hypothetical protein
MTIYNRHKNKGFLSIFALVSFAVLALPCLALGAGRAGGNSGGFGVSRPAGPQTHFHGFHGRGFIDGNGFFDGNGGVEVTVEQSQPTATSEPEKPAHKGRYVQPHWVDGGYGVQVLAPGYWTDAEKETGR